MGREWEGPVEKNWRFQKGMMDLMRVERRANVGGGRVKAGRVGAIDNR